MSISAEPNIRTELSAGAGHRVDVREVLRLLNRRKWQIAGIAGLVCALTGVVLLNLTPQFRATSLVMLDTRKVKVTNTQDVLSGMSTDIAAVQTEIEVLKSASLLGRVVDKLRLDLDPEFGAAPPNALGQLVRTIRVYINQHVGIAPVAKEVRNVDDGPRARALVILSRGLSTAPRGRSYVISVSVDSVDPAKARRIVDTLTDLYVIDQLQAKLDANKRATEFFNERLEELKRNVESSERAVAIFREKSGLTIGKDATVASQSLTELNTQLIQARAQRADRESRLIALRQAQKNPATLDGVTEVLGNPLIASLRAQEAEVGRRIGDLGQRYGDSHPRLLQARAEQAQIQGRIAAEVAKIIGSVQGDAEAAKAKEMQLQQQVDNLERQAGGLGQSEVELRQLQREAQSTRAVYEDFLKRFKELREQQDIQQPDARVLSAATVPPQPIFPRYTLTMSVALAAGMLLGAAFAGLIERLDGGFRTGEQIERMTGRPLLGMIPSLSKLSLGRLPPARFAIEKPASGYSEALRSAYTALTLGSLDEPPKVILVTSSLPGEGKTTFVCSLAGLLARSSPERKVIVVDCDMRRSSVLAALGRPVSGGTVDQYLAGEKGLDEILGRDEQSGVYYIAARNNTPNSAEILDSRAMANFIDILSKQFDLVFLDTPPVMAVSDARVAARLANYIIFLVKWEKTNREVVTNAMKLVRDLRKQVGVVLSQVNIRRHSRYGYGDYGYYYSKYKDYYTR